MKKEIVVTAKSIETAVELGADKLGVRRENVTYEVLELPKKGIFGLGASEAKVRVFGNMTHSEIAVAFLEKIIKDMNITASVVLKKEQGNELFIDINGNELGVLIGYHGEVMDSLQYLTYIAVNKEMKNETDDEISLSSISAKKEIKINLDIENYRQKREHTLIELAKKMADRVIKTNRSVTLDPMNSYERRIIHSAIQDIEGITTYSVGQDAERKIVIAKEGYKSYKNDRNNPPRKTAPAFKKTEYSKTDK